MVAAFARALRFRRANGLVAAAAAAIALPAALPDTAAAQMGVTPVGDPTYVMNFFRDQTYDPIVPEVRQTGGVLSQEVEHLHEPPGPLVTGTAGYADNTGVYWVEAAALNRAGYSSQVDWMQSFHKDSVAASLSFTITDLMLEAFDDDPRFRPLSSWAWAGLTATIRRYSDIVDEGGEFIIRQDEVFHTGAHILTWNDTFTAGYSGELTPDTNTISESGSHRVLSMGPQTFTINLNAIPVGEPFTIWFAAQAQTINDMGPESVVRAYVRDPLNLGGVSVGVSGLTATNDPLVPADTRLPFATGIPEPAAPAIALVVLLIGAGRRPGRPRSHTRRIPTLVRPR